jgi:hypoxia induced protein
MEAPADARASTATRVFPPNQSRQRRVKRSGSVEVRMNAITILILVAAAGAAIALFNGILSMAYGGEADRVNSPKHMFKRVAWQGAAVLLLLVVLLIANL